jgi:hypothetical protein
MRIGIRSRIEGGAILLLAAAILAAAVPVPARCGESLLAWDNLYDSGGGNDTTTGVAADAAGGVVAVANVATGGIRVRRYSGGGALTWSVPLPGVTIPLDRYFTNANPVFFPNGDVLIVGQSTSGATPDVYVGRFQSATGTLVWDNTYDLGGTEEPRCGQVDASGNIVVVGQTVLPGPNRDIFAMKIDGSSRQVLWTNFISGSAASQPTDDRVTSGYSAVLAANGDVVVSGYQFGDFTNGDDIVVQRFASADGELLGSDLLDLGSDDKAYAAAITGDGPIFVVGRTRQPALPYSAIVLKYSSLSPPDRQISLDNVNGLGAVAVHVLVEGNENVLVGMEATTATYQEVVIRKLRAVDLTEIWTYRYDVPGAGDSLRGMAFDSEGRLVVLVQTANDNIGLLRIDGKGNLIDNVFLARAGVIGVAVSASPSGAYVFFGADVSNGVDQDAAVGMIAPPLSPASIGSSGGGGCFVATAAWGSPLEPEVSVLRRFRDSVLINSGAGRGFIALYYRWSPFAAHFMERCAPLRGAVRFLLVPVVMGVGIALAPFPIPASILAIFLLCSIVTTLFCKGKRLYK